MMVFTPNPELDLLPPVEQIQAALAAWHPRAKAVAAYVNDLQALATGAYDVTLEGMTVHLPDPFEQFPATRAALQRAQSRAGTYWAGNTLLMRWATEFLQFNSSFSGISTRILAIYGQLGKAPPTVGQRQEILALFTQLITELDKNQQLLVAAAQAYGAALPLLAEDKDSLGAEVAGITAATDSFEKKLLDLILKYTLSPLGPGLARIAGQAGHLQLDQLRRTGAALRQVVAECTQAHQAVAQLTGELATTLGRFRGLADALETAQEAEFTHRLQQMQFNIAQRQWQSVYDAVFKLLTSP
ncbi:hypothetical protein [Hymenobacter swuensis]|uniref:HBL/NHE enterotoxin family protein n=1 Tax=Hymenobacter swuensis DY53 TaxID=1227739 RepID=W8EVF1_9BACT|nr:hypothetical protein [Hymenobacter swuensis]AHJ97199.1 hypothetical protein Hsw_1604 [Hymenobacter swuensis DY53]